MPRLLPALTLATVLAVAACTSTAPPEPTPPPEEPVAEIEADGYDPAQPAYHALFFDTYGLRLYTTNPAGVQLIAPGASPALAHTAADTLGPLAAASPDGRYLATAYHPAESDSTILVAVDVRSGATWRLDAQPVRTIYSVAWRVDGRIQGAALAFGRYRAQGPEDAPTMGRGGVYRVPHVKRGETISVGCSASKVALRWRPDGHLLVGGSGARYVVEAEGCGTVSTFPLKRKRGVSFSPDGMRVAYFGHELDFDRDTRAYVTDTTFFLADADGANAFKPLGSERLPSSFDWMPRSDGIAFDTEARDVVGRTLAVYTFADSLFAFLMPPDETQRTHETEPLWSPTGSRLAFVRRTLGEASAGDHAIFSEGEIGMNRAVYAFDGPTERWGWASDDVLVLRATDGRAAAIHVATAASAAMPQSDVLLAVVPAPARL